MVDEHLVGETRQLALEVEKAVLPFRQPREDGNGPSLREQGRRQTRRVCRRDPISQLAPPDGDDTPDTLPVERTGNIARCPTIDKAVSAATPPSSWSAIPPEAPPSARCSPRGAPDQ